MGCGLHASESNLHLLWVLLSMTCSIPCKNYAAVDDTLACTDSEICLHGMTVTLAEIELMMSVLICVCTSDRH